MKFVVNNRLGIFFISKVLFLIDKSLNPAVLMCINKRSVCLHIELNMMVHNVALQLLRVLLNKVLVNRKIKISSHGICVHLPDLNNRLIDSVMHLLFCQGTLKGLLPDQLEALGCQIMLGNTYHLGTRPVIILLL